jgi:undecaprenyl-diphosphatase
MTGRTITGGRAGRAGRATPTRPQSSPGNQQHSLAGALADPRMRLAAGTAVMLVTAMAARRGRVSTWEATAFRAVNDLPGRAVPASPGSSCSSARSAPPPPPPVRRGLLSGDRQLAGWPPHRRHRHLGAFQVEADGAPSRPAALLPDTHRRGRDATGLGYLSGHAGVAVALGAAALPHLGPAGRALTLGAIPAVSLTRIYVGAHLPLDTAGGAALGLAIDAALALAHEHARPAPRWRRTSAAG